ncbi:MAG TPA: OmpA family protein [Burkholderiales bacterium]|nr:OmpA family protein [Burkholderiales bacterium]
MRVAAIAAVLLLAACAAQPPRDEGLQAAYAAAEAESAALEARLRESEEARQKAEARAKELEQARELSDKLSAEVRRLEAEVAALRAHETEQGWILTLGSDVLFDVGEAKLKPAGARAIAKVARFMREQPERKIVIEGFTDDRGSPRLNQRLSEERAHAVREALVKQGIEPQRIVARGLGPHYPVAANSDARGRSLNRRVEILIGETVGRAATGAGSRAPESADRRPPQKAE